MTLPKPCIKCGKPGKPLCDHCRARLHRPVNPRYREPEYIRNRRLMIDRAWINLEPCVICGRPFASKSDITAEHIVSLRRGGDNSLDNLGPAHGRCNFGKHAP
jgi:5-methylcytosine-specific restriction endonuclease McrA